ncbi:MAG: thermonuclease family protein [Patescibacteria group bacterium]|nr:thermonuclease family protein [Patescibacteria group bacterium]
MKEKRKKRIVLIPFLLLFTLLLCGCDRKGIEAENTFQVDEIENRQQELFNVLHVVDGDTFSVWMNDKIETVRVIGIDSPETGEKYRRKECFGRESTQMAIEVLSDKKVLLKTDLTQDDRDQYDRLLRHVFLEDGTNYGLKMIEIGFAEELTFKGRQYEHQDEYKSAQEKAKQDKQGLWEVCKSKQ